MSKDDSHDEVRRALLAALPLLAAAGVADAQDAARVQPRAYRVVLENDALRVIEFNSRPGMGVCGTGMHSHPAHLNISLTDARVRIKLQSGKVFEAPNTAGDVWWSEAETHETENISGHHVRALIVELKSGKAKG